MLDVFDMRQGLADWDYIATSACASSSLNELVFDNDHSVNTPSWLACHSQALRIWPRLAVLVTVDRAAFLSLTSACALRTKADIRAGWCHLASSAGAEFCSEGN